MDQEASQLDAVTVMFTVAAVDILDWLGFGGACHVSCRVDKFIFDLFEGVF